eukprot:CAMPEP_0185028990 /NCGR_PEP_ID=MMETSP1103-20130426/15087_1 /TAXON_ID=36769 /ORGANISM="Paraphysomonas bandaiensis, Strain Caron Lab Isolate" /LENGTH=312 /DNA_ID=CAMNT_0027563589 /DNA_START=90 /DNA_END=1028 /DNA_ORIENTATION=-
MSDLSLSLSQIEEELNTITSLANSGQSFNENRLDVLLQLREDNEEYQIRLKGQHMQWMKDWGDFCYQCLLIMRGYIPHTIFESSIEDLERVYPLPLARRLFQKQCLWLVREDKSEIARMHESVLFSRYNPEGHDLDVVELSALYCCLPEKFSNDKKEKWRERIEARVKNMTHRMESNILPLTALRHECYTDVEGAFSDLESVHRREVVSHENGRRKSFTDVCQRHSLLSNIREERDKNENADTLEQLETDPSSLPLSGDKTTEPKVDIASSTPNVKNSVDESPASTPTNKKKGSRNSTRREKVKSQIRVADI